MSEELRNYGWRKDKYNPLAKLHAPTVPVKETPSYFSMESYLPYVRNQGSSSSCVGHGVGGTLGTVSKQLSCFKEWDSPLWIYNGARYMEGWLAQDCGCYPEDALKWVTDMGRLVESYWPYTGFDPATPTSNGRGERAFKNGNFVVVRVADGIDGIVSALAEGHPVNIGTPWASSWGSYKEGILPEITKDSSIAGGHDTFLYGYDKTSNVFFGQNSWGVNWGDKGKYKMPMNCFTVFKQMGGYDAHYIAFVCDPITPDPIDPVKPHCNCSKAIVKTLNAIGKPWMHGKFEYK